MAGNLPVVSYEGVARQGQACRHRPHANCCFLREAPASSRPDFFGVLTQGFPQLVRVNQDVLRAAHDRGLAQGRPGALCRVKMINEFPLIPDLERLEAMLARESVQA